MTVTISTTFVHVRFHENVMPSTLKSHLSYTVVKAMNVVHFTPAMEALALEHAREAVAKAENIVATILPAPYKRIPNSTSYINAVLSVNTTWKQHAGLLGQCQTHRSMSNIELVTSFAWKNNNEIINQHNKLGDAALSLMDFVRNNSEDKDSWTIFSSETNDAEWSIPAHLLMGKNPYGILFRISTDANSA